MKHIGLFEGIGGFSLAAQKMNWETVAVCENNPFCQQVLKYHFPDAEIMGDITQTNFKKFENTIDIVTGGFPCQPYSVSGLQKGTEDERHLWPEMLRAIREIGAPWVIGENVRGLIGWNGGLVFDQVQADLEAEGYEVIPFLLPACAVDAPHRRERIWFIAYSSVQKYWLQQLRKNRAEESQAQTNENKRERNRNDVRRNGTKTHAANSESTGLQGSNQFEPAQPCTSRLCTNDNAGIENSNFSNFPTQSPVCNGNDGIFANLDAITFPKWRNESIKAGGNAIVHQVALQIYKAIEQFTIIQDNNQHQWQQ